MRGHDCVAPGCDFLRKGCEEKRSLFSFPKEKPRLDKWLRNLGRKDFQPSKSSTLCEIHFEDHFILRESSAIRPDGTTVSFRLAKPRLSQDAVPTLFPANYSLQSERGKEISVPSYHTSKTPKPRTDPSARRKKAEINEERLAKMKEELKRVRNVDEVLVYLNRRTEEKIWTLLQSATSLQLYTVQDNDGFVVIEKNICILADLSVRFSIHKIGTPVNVKLPLELGKIENHDEIDALLNHCQNEKTVPYECFQKDVADSIGSLRQHFEEDSEATAKIGFIKEQVLLLGIKPECRRYFPEMLSWAAALHVKSAAAYRMISSTSALTLPCESSIKKVMKPYRSGPGMQQLQLKNVDRISKRAKTDRERLVNLHIDEISVRPKYSYKGGKIVGQAYNCASPATEVVAFMITGVASGVSEIVMLVPSHNMTAEELHKETMDVLSALEERGIKVVSIITDNHKKNQSLFSLLARLAAMDDQTCWIPNPFAQDRPLFLVIDPVHIIKTIRNNWYQHGTLIYPSIRRFFKDEPEDTDVLSAHWSHFQHAYSIEQTSNLKATPLTAVSVAPNSLERQNVNIALKVFSERTARGLELMAKNYPLEMCVLKV
ncbi:uncharacterized protein LOC129587779 [Paramacrobiotus metropolitanus]|uniref:uncharacterized protein LOC129587779 n=1 Tax=Paramacrobiotus metropolitanus TaxID=2943436 RepID=UPI002445D096|nr:uncharacterized protein LOC129587779 [Paramacrobiotus metropolitanus]